MNNIIQRCENHLSRCCTTHKTLLQGKSLVSHKHKFLHRSSTERIAGNWWAAEREKDQLIQGRNEIQFRKDHPWEDEPLMVGNSKLWYPSRAKARCCQPWKWPLGTAEMGCLGKWCTLPLQVTLAEDGETSVYHYSSLTRQSLVNSFCLRIQSYDLGKETAP